MAEDEAKLMQRQKDAEKRYNEEMAELQQLRDLQVICDCWQCHVIFLMSSFYMDINIDFPPPCQIEYIQ